MPIIQDTMTIWTCFSQNKELLALARLILIEGSREWGAEELPLKIWSLRAAVIVQSVLDEKSDQLFSRMKAMMADMKVDTTSNRLTCLLYLEEAKLFAMFHQGRNRNFS